MKMCCISCGQSVVQAPAQSLFPFHVHLGVYRNGVPWGKCSVWASVPALGGQDSLLPTPMGQSKRLAGQVPSCGPRKRGASLHVLSFIDL